MGLPNHDPACRAHLQPLDCWGCGAPVSLLRCSCGHCLLLESAVYPWPVHACGAAGWDLGGKGLTGWQTGEALQRGGIPLEALPPATTPREPLPAPIAKGALVEVLGVLRGIHKAAGTAPQIETFGAIGAALLQASGQLAQIVVDDPRTQPPLRYTCAADRQFLTRALTPGVMVRLTARALAQGAHRFWVAEVLDAL